MARMIFEPAEQSGDDSGDLVDEIHEETLEDAIAAAVAVARVDSAVADEPMTVVVCLHEGKPPCPRREPGGGCALCRRITVQPDGTLTEEGRA